MERLQFRVLFRVFMLRVVDLELLSADGDPTKLLGQCAALLAGISFLFCLPLLLVGGGWRETDLWTMEHLFVAATMLAIGLFSVLNWDSIFPDRRDVLVLAPLPVAPRTIFAAKLSALGSALFISVLALNVFTGLLWPMYFSSADGALAVLRSFGAYWTTVLTAAAFMLFFVLTLLGVASLLPRQLFLRLSVLLQVAAFCLFIGVFIVEPTSVTPEVLREPGVQCLPTFWFFGLFQQLNGVTGPMQSVIAELAHRAWIALAIAASGALATLLLSYFHTLRKIVESPDIVSGSHRIKWPVTFGKSLQGAVTSFCLRTLLRSRSHRVILSFYFGVGFAIVLAYVVALYAGGLSSRGAASAFVSAPFLSASILMMCISIGGIRIVASMPIALRANWIFRITELQQPSAYIAAVRRAFVVISVLPIWLASAVLFFSVWPLRLALEHLLVLGLLGMILVEATLHGSKKIPFTCSYLPGKGNLQYVFWACALLLLPLINAGAQIEMRMLDSLFGYSALLVALSLALAITRWRTAAVLTPTTQMQFDEVEAPELLSLSLTRE